MKEKLLDMLSPALGQAEAAQIIDEVFRSLDRTDGPQAVVVLLGELADLSAKAAHAAVEALPELHRRGVLSEIVQWLDLALVFAHASGAATLRYVRESPLLISLIEPASARRRALASTLELAEEDHAAALEFLRVAPELTQRVELDQLDQWAGIGMDVSQQDPIAGIEFIRQSPAIAQVLVLSDMRQWIDFGLKLVTTNSLGKTDYFGTIEFFRTSPAALAEIHPSAARSLTIALGARLADSGLDLGTACLAEAPRLLSRLPSDDWRMDVLQYGLLLADRDAQATLAYFRRVPELLSLLGAEARPRFEQWFKAGMEILDYNLEAGRAYFAVESHQALAALEQAASGVPLRRVARSVTLFAQALCGRPVRVHALSEGEEQHPRAAVGAEGLIIYLPSIVRRYATYEENARLYRVMAAHEAGHVEFGTYDVPLSRLADLVTELQAVGNEAVGGRPKTLAGLFALYPQPGLIRDLWTILEDARVEYLLQREYPGLRRDLALLAEEAVKTRTLSHGLTVRELVVDQLLLRSTAADPESVPAPDAVVDIVAELWDLCRLVLTPAATAELALRTAHRVYLRLDELMAERSETIGGDDEPSADTPAATVPRASEDMSSEYYPVSNWDYRGTMDPNLVRQQAEDSSAAEGTEQPDAGEVGIAGSSGSGQQGAGTARGHQAGHEALAPGRDAPSLVEEVLALEGEAEFSKATGHQEGRLVRYPEWDAAIQDYRSHWCRLVEREAEEGSSEFVEQTLAAQRGPIRLLRRYFESLRPAGFTRLPGQIDGEDVDLDAVVRRLADIRAGAEPSDHIYIRGERQERAVAAAVLVDVSGSTSRHVTAGRRVIDIEKEGLVMLCEALDAIGDQFALYGYSGAGRKQVDFVVIKDFDDPVSGRAARKLGGIVPLHQNRDGAAIRHATRKLLAREAKTRLLILISDGRPLDDGYKDDYSLEDTKMALREARMKGVEPFCITIDREADQYLRRMYGDIRYIVIDDVEGLPDKLPKIYHRLTR
ncbi:MAG: VWA domain-containing protein [Nitrospira sp.]